MKYNLFAILLTVFLASCGSESKSDYKVIDDLPFKNAQDAKSYADLVLKAIRTNRDLPVWQEFADRETISQDSLGLIIGMYSTGIAGRDDWEYIDVYKDSASKDASNGYNYAWLDPSGRLGIQIKIIPEETENDFVLKTIEFRSRLDVMESKGFPGGSISDYEKLDYDWEAKLKRQLEQKEDK